MGLFSRLITCLFFALFFGQVVDVLLSLQGSSMEPDDPITSYMLQVIILLFCLHLQCALSSFFLFYISYLFVIGMGQRFCKCLGQDFLPYMSVVMPPLLQSAHLKPDVTITSADFDDDIDESDDNRFVFIVDIIS